MPTTLVPPTHPALWAPAMSVLFGVNDHQLAALVADLRAVLERESALGVAAPQLGVTLSVFVWKAGEVVVNPDYETIYRSPTSTQPEGCLTWPGQTAMVTRHETCIAYWQDLDGKERSRALSGLEARMFAHETDHCQGRCVFPRPSVTWDQLCALDPGLQSAAEQWPNPPGDPTAAPSPTP